MKIHRVELCHVRQFKRLSLDLSAPITVIAGPNGVGKTTLQKAILLAMFHGDKKDRDGLISRFDPDSPPRATLSLSRGNALPSITLSRKLTDETGEWTEGATTVKGRGKALEKIQECLPITAGAAAKLLWGLQEDMAAIIDQFPPDGHTLLTATTIKGSGPDPKEVIEDLEKEFMRAKKGGKDPGPLSQAANKVKTLEDELKRAQDAYQRLRELKEDLDRAKSARDQAQRLREDTKREVERLAILETLLEAALEAKQNLSALKKKQEEWDGLDDEIKSSQGTLIELQDELAWLKTQCRVAKDKELAERIRELKTQIKSIKAAETRRDAIEKSLGSKRRPDKQQVTDLRGLQEAMKETSARMEASGLRYELAVASGSQFVKLSEDGAAEKEIELVAGLPHEGVVGNVVITAQGLRFGARGKEDIAAHKRSIQQAQEEILALLKRFAADNEEAFQSLAEEKQKLDDDLKAANNEVKGSTLDALESDLELLEQRREENNVTQQDLDACSGRHLASAADIERTIIKRETQGETCERDLKKLLAKRPTEIQKSELNTDLETARNQADNSVASFKNADETRQEPTAELLHEIKESLKNKRDDFSKLMDPQKNPENEVTRLSTELKYAGPERRIASIESDLEEAKAVLHHEQVLQSARELLTQRIRDKIMEMTAEVPRELGDKISTYLAQLTKGACRNVILSDVLVVTGIHEGGQYAEQWPPQQLSHGERHQAALAIKIAVARALAETSGPVFMILDDSLVSFDPERRAATEQLLFSLVADGKLQVILLTCHTDWAADWKKRSRERLNYIELAKVADYYRLPPAIASVREG